MLFISVIRSRQNLAHTKLICFMFSNKNLKPTIQTEVKVHPFKKFKIGLPKVNTHLFGTLLTCEILTKPSE